MLHTNTGMFCFLFRDEESWVELEALALEPTDGELNNNNDPSLEENKKSTGVIKKLYVVSHIPLDTVRSKLLLQRVASNLTFSVTLEP